MNEEGDVGNDETFLEELKVRFQIMCWENINRIKKKDSCYLK